MRKALKITIAAVLSVLMLASVLPMSVFAETSIYVVPVNLPRGASADLRQGQNYGDAVWVSDKPAVASVDANGVVKGLKVGWTYVEVVGVHTGLTLKRFRITVYDKVDVNSIYVSSPQTEYSDRTNKIQLSATIYPENATNKNVTWKLLYGSEIANLSSTGELSTFGTGAIRARAVADDNVNIFADVTVYVGGATAENWKGYYYGWDCGSTIYTPYNPYCYYDANGILIIMNTPAIPTIPSTPVKPVTPTPVLPFGSYAYLGTDGNLFYYNVNGQTVALPYMWNSSSANCPYIYYGDSYKNLPCGKWTGSDYMYWNCCYTGSAWTTPADIVAAHPNLSYIIGKDADGKVYIIGTVGELLSSHQMCAKCGKCKTCGQCKCTYEYPTYNPPTTIPAVNGKWTCKFGDVKSSDWYYTPIAFACGYGYINGVNAKSFGVYDTFTRGSMIIALANYAGVQTARYKGVKHSVEDVAKTDSLHPYVQWALDNDIVDLDSENNINADETMTRGEFAYILYQYAKALGIDVTKTVKLTSYYDSSAVSADYRTAMAWAVANSLLPMNYPQLNPKGFVSKVYLANALYLIDAMK